MFINQGNELGTVIGDYRETLIQMSQPILPASVFRLTREICWLIDKSELFAQYLPIMHMYWLFACWVDLYGWVFREDRTIIRIDIHGIVKDAVSTPCKCGPLAFSATRDKEMIYIDSETCHIFRHNTLSQSIDNEEGSLGFAFLIQKELKYLQKKRKQLLFLFKRNKSICWKKTTIKILLEVVFRDLQNWRYHKVLPHFFFSIFIRCYILWTQSTLTSLWYTMKWLLWGGVKTIKLLVSSVLHSCWRRLFIIIKVYKCS